MMHFTRGASSAFHLGAGDYFIECVKKKAGFGLISGPMLQSIAYTAGRHYYIPTPAGTGGIGSRSEYQQRANNMFQ